MKSTLYQQQQVDSRTAGETNDCVVKMVAMALRVSYARAHALCAEYGREPRRGMFQYQWMKLLQDQGVVLEWVCFRDMIDQYPGVHSNLRNITTHHPARFNKVWDDGHRYIMTTAGHVLYIDHGRTHDWTEGRAFRAQGLWRIVE